MAACHSLERKILAALKAAFAEERLDIAEHLVCALEVLESEPTPGSALGQAYAMIAGSQRKQRRSRRPS
ncbi:hypothetical protein ACETIH_10475 [Microvirga arabica]|uniref:Uncharacterized protein n=1 Tax=Microvirga arabica TaxID=1128671 RepID=A0ABV6Y790_9HYPH